MRGGFGSRLRNDNQEEIKLREIDKDTIKLLFKYLKPNSKRLSLAFLAMVVVTASSLAGPYLIKLAVDDYILQKDFRGLNIILLFLYFNLMILHQFLPVHLWEVEKLLQQNVLEVQQ